VPKIDIAKATVRTRASYPDPWRAIAEGREKAARPYCNRATLRVSRPASPTVTTSSIGRNVMRFIWESGRALSVSVRTIRMSISFMTGTKAAFVFHAGRGSLTRTAVDRARREVDALLCTGGLTQLPSLATAV
jgi:hypothetical protein